MPAQLICLGHGGLMNSEELLDDEQRVAVNGAIWAVREAARNARADVVVQFGNDHNSGFSLQLMPPFLVALRARTLGDFDTSCGSILLDEANARALVRSLHAVGIDVATSYDALFDHGFTMALDKLFGGIDAVPVIPVFTNCGGDLRPPFHRSLALGTAIGDFFRTHLQELRVLYLGSGGLSHDPPLPDFETSPPEVQQRMITGTQWTAESLAERTRRVQQAGIEHGRGDGDLLPLNPEWDDWVLDCLFRGELESLAALDDAEVMRTGGRGAAEVRNWLAAFAALRAHEGDYRINHEFYRALPSWITGFAAVHAEAA